MKSSEIRERFLSYFEKKGHLRLPSSSLIPADDPTLLFNNAGMNQFKNVFLGAEKPKGPKASTSQKCVRAGGKHNDLDNVGFTARHHTFFEMLGNFSFGDYFKKEAIELAWGFLTEELKLPKEKLFVTAFHDDPEAKKLWIEDMGIPEDHFKTFGEKDNFWRMGDTGPCGPCSEIFYDLGPEMGDGPENTLGGEGDRFVEIWNLVFMQYEEKEDGTKTPLKNPSIDTGMGLERISMVMQNTKSNYETDLFQPIIDLASKLTNTPYDPKKPKSAETSALRVLADHARAVCFLIADGVLPSNEGRGYVLRRILRRAVRFNKKLEAKPIFPLLCEKVIEMMSVHYNDLDLRKSLILDYVKEEESKFLETLDNGERLLNDEISKLKDENSTELSGEVAFKLYDTFGFPLDLTEVILKEEGLSLNHESFEQALNTAKEKSKGASSFKTQSKLPESLKDSVTKLEATKFLGYEQDSSTSKILEIHTSSEGLVSETSTEAYVLFDQTPFYAEGGGQVGDSGKVTCGESLFNVKDVQKIDHLFLHILSPEKGTLKVGDICNLTVDSKLKSSTKKNHSATHLLHAALINHCGDQVQQAGSSVNAKRLRFDFNHKGPVSDEKLQIIEDEVNIEISKETKAHTKMMDLEEAKNSGAQALFGEKYDEKVRVLNLGEGYSIELCGGTHVSNTKEIELFKIVSESSVGSGVRRIEAITGDEAKALVKIQASYYDHVLKDLGCRHTLNSDVVTDFYQNLKSSVKELKSLAKSGASKDKLTDKLTDAVSLKCDESGESYNSLVKSTFYTETLRCLNLSRSAKPEDVSMIFNKLRAEAEKHIETLSGETKTIDLNEAKIEEVDSINLGLLVSDSIERAELGSTSDKLLDKLGENGLCVVVGSANEKGAPIAISRAKSLEVHAGQLLKSITTELGGKGGGRDNFAQGSLNKHPSYSDLSDLVKNKL